MKKLIVMLVIALLCTGCSSNTQQKQEPNNETSIVYSNLIDESAQKEVADSLEKHAVTKEQTETLLAWADDFNFRITSAVPPEGFRPMENSTVDYTGLMVKEKESEGMEPVPEANCRLTSYLLMKNLIETNGTTVPDDTILIFDIEAIEGYEQFRLSKEEQQEFTTLFNWVSVQGANTLEEHIQAIQKAWQDREIKIEGEGISLICVYLHNPFDEVRFVGHTGVLLETDTGLLFVEKYGPLYPFQATKFHDREELKQYLLSRADLYGDETELAPIVMENDRVL